MKINLLVLDPERLVLRYRIKSFQHPFSSGWWMIKLRKKLLLVALLVGVAVLFTGYTLGSQLSSFAGKPKLDPENARDAAINYIEVNHPGIGISDVWSGGRVAPAGILGHETY